MFFVYQLFWLYVFVCMFVCVCVRFLSGSCLSGQSATRPAATCKASTTWSRRSLLSTSSSTSVSAISLISCVICYWCDDLHFYCKSCSPQWRVTLYAGKTWGNQPWDPSRWSFFSQLSSQWTPPVALCLFFPLPFLPSVCYPFIQISTSNPVWV